MMKLRIVSLFCVVLAMSFGLSSCLSEQSPTEKDPNPGDTTTSVGDQGVGTEDLCADVVCDDSLSEGCLVNGCNPANGVCQLLPDDSRCDDDGDACTAEKCGTDGVCQAADMDCDDDNPCTTDSCDSEKGCSYSVVEDTGQCGVNSACAPVDGGLSACTCDEGYGDCNEDYSDGCEVDVFTDMEHCGACETECGGPAYANATAVCAAGECSIGSCSAGFEDCNAVAGDGCESNINLDPANCGACANDCNQGAGANAAGVCVTLAAGPTCSVVCNAGFADCNVNLEDGCEIDLDTIDNCGSCGNNCSAEDYPNAIGICAEGSCVVGSCDEGFADCNADLSDGCEADIGIDLFNCGACGNACGGVSYDNATVGCLDSDNGPGCGMICDEKYADCNEDSTDGCESDTTSLDNCGACGNACNSEGLANATMTCTEGVSEEGEGDGDFACTIVCDINFADCNADPTDGCEVDLTLPENCGGCGNDCAEVSFNNAAATCLDEPGKDPVCVLGACAANFADCNEDPSDGCEVSLTTPMNCGACGKYCSGGGDSNSTPICQVLEDGAVCGINCEANYLDCNGLAVDGCEVNRLSDALNCGGCAMMCTAINANSASCTEGSCQIDCYPNFADCNGSPNDGCELNTSYDPQNCGACGNKCEYDNGVGSCWQQSCKLEQCNDGWRDCDMDTSNGCEAEIASSVTNCGACGNECNSANGTPSCVEGTCELTCDEGFEDCNGDPADGCEVDTRNNPLHCGGCGNVCDYENATPACAANASGQGECLLACYTAYGNCDGETENGCETRIWDDVENCGACGNVCSFPNGEGKCEADTCSFVENSCSQFFENCNGQPDDGCEAAIITDPNNCGGCGVQCDFASDGVDNLRGQCQPDFSTGTLVGTCYNEACPAGFLDCNDNFNDGCEVEAEACP